MALTPKKVYAILKKYTDDSVAGGGTIKGKNCTVKSIDDITGGHRVTFEWTLDNGTVKTDTMDVMDGNNGQDGEDGLTPVITVDEVSGGHSITITIGEETPIVFNVMDGATGSQGPAGPAGQGVPTGGTVGQVLKKKSGTNYDTEWADESGGGTGHGRPSGGSSGQILSINSDDDYDAKWTDPATYSQEQSNWMQNDDSKVDYIKNKPANLVQDASYVHTDNNFTSELKTKLDNIASGAQVNVIEGITLNGTAISPDASKVVALTVITKAVNDLENYYVKSDTYTKTEVNNLISGVATLDIQVVAELPTTDISLTTIYLVPKSSSASTSNIYDEWICLDKTSTPVKWEKIGDTQIDLSGYALKSEMSVTNGTGTDADKVTIQLKSGTTATVLKTHQDISGKQNTITISGKKGLV